MVYKLSYLARSMLNFRNCIIFLVLLCIGNAIIATNTPVAGANYGTVISTVPREFFVTDKANPYRVTSSCAVTVEFVGRSAKETRQLLDTGCVYKPGDRIDRYLKTRNTAYQMLLVVIIGFMLLVVLALALPKHPTITPQ